MKKKIQKIELSAEEKLKIHLEREFKEIKQRYIPANPTYMFKVGDNVQLGALNNSVVSEVYENGLYYKITSEINKQDDLNKYLHNIRIVAWNDIQPYRTQEEIKKIPIFNDPSSLMHKLRFCNTGLGDLFSMKYHFGLDMNPPYQRDYVWSLEQKQQLIDSIFNIVPIGVFVYNRNRYDCGKELYTVIDGKQRINALTEYVENRFQYKGKYFNDLHPRDQNCIENYGILKATCEEFTLKEQMEVFVKINSTGVIQNVDHLKHVQSMIDKM
jgi:uncharacterized protein with ParB-like and HNH nuclease domain